MIKEILWGFIPVIIISHAAFTAYVFGPKR